MTRDTPEPSPISHEILNARPYAFLDDAPLEERRTQAVYARRASEPATAGDIGALDPEAIARVRDEARPDPRDADELHDALVTAGFLTDEDSQSIPLALFDALRLAKRATRVRGLWVAAERVPELRGGSSRSRGSIRRSSPHPAARHAHGRATRRWSSCCAAGCP